MRGDMARKKNTAVDSTSPALFGQNLTFAAKEAYKLLRTNLMFSLPELPDGRGYVIGITSSLRGEGKSTTTINLATTLAEQGERVLVIEADLRLPSLHKKLSVSPKPGLSNILVSRADPTRFIQRVEVGSLNEQQIGFDVMTAGDIPPNPSELIGSSRMKQRLEKLSASYNFILLDLPPVTAVTDALVATSLVDGIVMVVRNEYTDSGSLKEAMRQLKLVEAKMLGFVYTCAGTSSNSYRKRYKYRYYSDYESGK